jgi:hypothetical protein
VMDSLAGQKSMAYDLRREEIRITTVNHTRLPASSNHIAAFNELRQLKLYLTGFRWKYEFRDWLIHRLLVEHNFRGSIV